jgi:hypothetical protein
MNRPLIGLLSATALLSGCASASPGNPRPSGGVADIGNAVVLEKDQLFDPRGSLLNVIASRLSNSRIVHDGGCAGVEIRGSKNFVAPVLPGVYVDGQRAGTSCVFELLNTEDIARVEVYPMGVTRRPGYTGSAGGLILVFLKNGSEM